MIKRRGYVQKKPVGHTIWLKIVLTVLVFAPLYVGVPYDPEKTSDIIAAVLKQPLIASAAWALPMFKLLLLAAVLLTVVSTKFSRKLRALADSTDVVGVLDALRCGRRECRSTGIDVASAR